MKRYSPRQIRRTLRKYDTRDTIVRVSPSLELSILETEDAYSLLDRMIEQEGAGRRLRFPYWAEVWPASLALSRWFCESAEPASEGMALELGCGLGLVGISLSRMGWRVEATDFVEDALIFTSHNARKNAAGGRHTVSYLDWSNPVGSPCQALIGSDLAYDRQNHPYLNRVIRHLLAPGGRLYMSDPGRPAAQPFFATLQKQRFRHEQHRLSVDWKSLEHRVDIHVFTKPLSA